MSAPTSKADPFQDLAHGSLEMMRACIGETVAGASIHADLAATYAGIQDDVGLDYALRCLVADVRAAISLLAHLKEQKATERARAAAEELR
ncbi:hypothetical protein VQ03_27380 [Methylobacterium tarhaniae]|uniref:Uncharacterized protein n=1 Tax=Methylobacterium tarhaniae TaxID=1187852 RepID=A0A0J6UY55_9HYPH|nr:hypothetical protein [Methylobacterium tarhaniae]KMO31316.1 hypothetical protein VQ03_27380 [Methylobacterium tarhaniae]